MRQVFLKSLKPSLSNDTNFILWKLLESCTDMIFHVKIYQSPKKITFSLYFKVFCIISLSTLWPCELER